MKKQKIAVIFISLCVVLSAAFCFLVQHNKIATLQTNAQKVDASVKTELSSRDSVISELKEKNARLEEDNKFANEQLYSYDQKDFSVFKEEQSKFYAKLNKSQKDLYSYAYEDGYNRGYEEGYDSGYDEGENEGDNNGYSSGQESGYEEGYQDGYDKGFYEGYKERENEED